jgi:TetR/AcrR family fatty acid metabolism transcriptional regulator
MNYTPRQIEIIEAATKLIGSKGIQNVTTKNLAEEMGFSEPALYRHFSGKSDILSSVLEFFRLKMNSEITPRLVNKDTGLEKIHELISYLFTMFSRNPAVIMVIFSETSFQYDNKLSDSVNHLREQLKNFALNMLDEGAKDKSIRNDLDPEQLTSIILGSMRFTVLQWRLSDFSFNLNTKGEKLWQTLHEVLKYKR